MDKLTLSPRLSLIASLVPAGGVAADVGTDHGYIPVWLIQNGVVDFVIATDIHEGPLARARQVCDHYGVSNRIKLLLCDGLAAVKEHEANTVVIAGMGGETMIDILESAPWTKDETRLILQPQSKQPELRSWLCDKGYAIDAEYLVKDAGKMYCVFTVSGGKMEKFTLTELYTGKPELHKDKQLLKEYLMHESKKLKDIADKLENSVKGEDHHRRNEFIEVAAGMDRMLEELQS